MSKRYKLSHNETIVLKNYREDFVDTMRIYNEALQFKLGDYVILKEDPTDGDDENVKLVVRANSYGTPVKFKVVYVNEDGHPFIKQVNKTGNTIGELMSMTGTAGTDSYGWSDFKFELDPDYADAILLGETYDAAKEHKSKQEMWKAITKHNKASKINNEVSNLIKFFDTVKIGDTLWNSINKFYLVEDIVKMSKKEFNNLKNNKFKTSIRGSMPITVLTVKEPNGNRQMITADFFCYKALYKDRPRSYKELNT